MRAFGLMILTAVLMTVGCYSFKEGQIDPNIKSVAIANFTNTSLNGSSIVSQRLTDALKDRFLTQTSLTLTNRGGDIEFSGNITGYDIRGTGLNANSSTDQNRLTVTVRVEFINNIDDKDSYSKSFSAFADYDSSQNLASVENELLDLIFFQLVEQMYNEALMKW